MKQCQFRFKPVLKQLMADELGLERGEERFCHGAISAISLAANALDTGISVQFRSENAAGKLNSAIAIDHEPRGYCRGQWLYDKHESPSSLQANHSNPTPQQCVRRGRSFVVMASVKLPPLRGRGLSCYQGLGRLCFFMFLVLDKDSAPKAFTLLSPPSSA